ncbi:MAG: Uma2 family endonuclease [Bacteroidota bacterium]
MQQTSIHPISLTFPSALRLGERDLLNFRQHNPELLIERSAEGQLNIHPPYSGTTLRLLSQVNNLLWNWNSAHKQGLIFDSSTAFRLPGGAIYSSGLAWLNVEKWHGLHPEDRKPFPRICPDVVLEMRARLDLFSDIPLKMHKWKAAGCRLAWLIDPYNKHAYVYRKDAPGIEVIADFSGVLNGGEVLPGFELPLKIF